MCMSSALLLVSMCVHVQCPNEGVHHNTHSGGIGNLCDGVSVYRQALLRPGLLNPQTHSLPGLFTRR